MGSSGEQAHVQTLWVGESLSRLERLSLSSFVSTGHIVDLYAYDEVQNIPDGVRLLDGGDIMAREHLLGLGPRADGTGSWAMAADVFRYRLLLERGGWWIDTDVVALCRFNDAREYFFAYQDEALINVAVLKMPAGCQLARLLCETSELLGPGVQWAETGPNLLTTLVRLMELADLAAGPETVYPIHWSETGDLVAPDPGGTLWRRLEGACAIHLWNEMWRRYGLDKDATYSPTSVYERLRRQYDCAP